MHGRLKVKTTAQQEAEKKKERAVKLAGYRHAMAAILARRRDGHQDEEQLQLTAQVLTANPDIHTLWNIRRECVHSLVSGQVSAQLLGGVQHNFPSVQARAGDGEAEGEGEAAWRREVELTAQCLITNPKSYGAWHHRCYSLDQVTTNTIT